MVALQRGLNVSCGVHCGIPAGQVTALPVDPHCPALLVCDAQLALVAMVLHVMQLDSPAVTTRHVLVARSHGRCTSSSECPSQQSSKPRLSNSWSPADSWAGSVWRWPQVLPGVCSAPSTPMNEPRP